MTVKEDNGLGSIARIARLERLFLRNAIFVAFGNVGFGLIRLKPTKIPRFLGISNPLISVQEPLSTSKTPVYLCKPTNPPVRSWVLTHDFPGPDPRVPEG